MQRVQYTYADELASLLEDKYKPLYAQSTEKLRARTYSAGQHECLGEDPQVSQAVLMLSMVLENADIR